jgi:hypothetical protein
MDRIREKQSFFVFSHPVHPASEADPVIALKILSCTKVNRVSRILGLASAIEK